MPAGPVTMKDTALALGLSVAAVSLALSDHAGVGASTRRAMLAKAERMGYRKNPLVAALLETRRKRASPDKGTVLARRHRATARLMFAQTRPAKRASQPARTF